jgi:uncharacterized membrane protein
MPLAQNVVAVDQALGNVDTLLRAEGYRVVPLSSDLSQVEAVVVNGLAENLMGIEEIMTASTVIDASGLSAEQVLAQVKRSESRKS